MLLDGFGCFAIFLKMEPDYVRNDQVVYSLLISVVVAVGTPLTLGTYYFFFERINFAMINTPYFIIFI